MTFPDFCQYTYIFTAGALVGAWLRGKRAIKEAQLKDATIKTWEAMLADQAKDTTAHTAP